MGRSEVAVEAVPAVVRSASSYRKAAMIGVGLSACLSAALNGYHYSLHAPAAWAGWGLGLAVPCLILILGRVWGGATRKLVGHTAAGAGLALLALSVVHCADSIAAVTGSGQWLAIPLAVAIDCGLVACEMALLDE